MKRMTLLTALALVFSLFTVTAAIAGSGPGTGDGDQVGEQAKPQSQTQAKAQTGECEAAECQAEGTLMIQELIRECLVNRIAAMLEVIDAEDIPMDRMVRVDVPL